MNTYPVAAFLCHRLHPAEWDAPTPRQQPCADCTQLADDLAASVPPITLNIPAAGRQLPLPQAIKVGPVLTLDPPPPQVVAVPARCPACGYPGRRA